MNIHWNFFQELFFFFCDLHLHVDIRCCHGPGQEITGSDMTSGRFSQGVIVGGVTRCQRHLSIILAYLASKLQPVGLPVTLARPDTLYLCQPGEQQHAQRVEESRSLSPACSPTIL